MFSGSSFQLRFISRPWSRWKQGPQWIISSLEPVWSGRPIFPPLPPLNWQVRQRRHEDEEGTETEDMDFDDLVNNEDDED